MFDPELSTEQVLALDPSTLSGAALSAHVLAVRRICDRAQVALLAAFGQWDADTQWAADAFVSAPTWLVHHGSVSRAEAAELVNDARRLRAHSHTAAAAAQTLGPARARVLVRAVNERTADAFSRDEQMLIDQAQGLTVDETKRMTAFWARHADPDGAELDADQRRDRRRLHLSQYGAGNWRLDGELDAEAGLVLHNALALVSDELYRSEQRCDDGQPVSTATQRRADALVELARRGNAADPQRSVPARPLIMAVVDLDTLEGRTGQICELDDAGTITPQAAHRLACDAGISRVIVDGASQILDLGLTTPTPSPAQRRALRVRDKGCVVPGCDRPPGWCEAHHIRHRQDGGRTDLENLCLLCSRHHHMHHAGKLSVARDPTGRLTFTRADGTLLVAAPLAA